MMKVIGVLVGLAFATGAQAQSLIDKYELSERCGKRAEEVFAKGKEETTGLILAADNYENHYNSRLNRCFYLEIHETGETKSLRLFDLNDHKEIGSYVGELGIQGPVRRCGLQEKQRLEKVKELLKDKVTIARDYGLTRSEFAGLADLALTKQLKRRWHYQPVTRLAKEIEAAAALIAGETNTNPQIE